MLALAAVFVLSLLTASASAATDDAPPPGAPPAVVLDIKGPIGPATSDYVHRAMAKAQTRGAAVVVLRMDTPGGLDSAMREIIQDILAAPMPVVGFVGPGGSRAASAGTYILYGCHVAAMAPATNLGAATPIQIGGGGLPLPKPGRGWGGGDDAAEEEAGDGEGASSQPPRPHPTLADKAVSDAVAYIRSLAQMRGRNAEWAEKAVAEAASLSAEEALEAGVIDLIASDVAHLLEAIDGRVVEVRDQPFTLATMGRAVVAIEPDWRTELLGIITNPNVAYLLLLIGFYGLVFEFTHPGAIAPGVVGAIAFLLGLFALHVLPVNYAGLGLILVGLAFMVAEAFLPSFGALGIGGVAAFVIGSVMLLDTDVPGYGVSWPVIAAVGGISGTFFMVVLALAVRARKRPVVSGREDMIGSHGQVTDWADEGGRIRVRGELWLASAAEPIAPGARVRIAGIDGLVLRVEPDFGPPPEPDGEA
ncbi:MAG: nodulation protein NfeD [Alphaproteobacteria bacterium]|jgi:membrane-bound serine protease (ClpP class)|nr:nodulation protein NfeD [Alphaproteobacteria bacterium]MDP6517619.1 nodulation protein NfeD [Alphaproteobacteria bacterium]